jgi:hypothetical protein
MGEMNPSTLQKKLYYELPGKIAGQYFNEIPVRNYYSVNELLKFLMTIHKYSERFNNNQFELREPGIIYSDNDTYQLTIFAMEIIIQY